MSTLPQYLTPKWPHSLASIRGWEWSESHRELRLMLQDDAGYAVCGVLAIVPGGLWIRLGPDVVRPYSLLVDIPEPVPAHLTVTPEKLILESADLTVEVGRTAPYPFLHVFQPSTPYAWNSAPLGAGQRDDALYRGQGHASPGIAWLDAELTPGEALYGLGERFNQFNVRGQRIGLWSEDAFGLQEPESYIYTPWLMSTAGWGLFLPTAAVSEWDVGQSHGSTLRVTVAEATWEGYVFLGEMPGLLSRYLTLTGTPVMPPDWSFGLWMSRWGYRSEDEMMTVIDRLQRDHTPVSVVHLDPLWLTEKNGHTCPFEWDFAQFPDPEQMIRRLKDRGVRLSLWINPFLPRDSKVYRIAQEHGYLVLTDDGLPARLPRFDDDSGVVDFTNPAARAWYKELLRPLLDMGVAVFKTDFGESAPFDQARYANGVSGKVGHNLNALYYQQTVYEATEDHYPGQAMVWGRSGYAGIQRYPLQWGGDTGVTWEYMQKALRGALSYAMSGGIFTAFDVGGFAGTPTVEVYLRWAAMGFFFSHIRAHGTTPREPSAFGEEAVRNFRNLAHDRQTLMPYLLDAARHSITSGFPLVRPLVLMHPDDPAVHGNDYEYYLGPDLLVAPTLTGRATSLVYLPQGDWQSLYDPKRRFKGDQWYRLDSPPLDEIWCFKRTDVASVIATCPQQLR